MKEYIDNLNKILQYKEDIKQSIISKGQTVGDSLCTYADAISKISGGGPTPLPEILDTDPLTFVKVDNTGFEGYISLINNGVTNAKTFEYNKNDAGWTAYNEGDEIPMLYGDKIQFRSNDTTAVSTGNTAYRYFKTRGVYNCGGTLASLMNNNTTITLTNSCFIYLFDSCNIIKAPVLPWTKLGNNCYRQMFHGCNLLHIAPELPATTLTNGCYEYMFQGCTSLVNAPELPATTINYSCYNNMFAGCTSLVNGPTSLPATKLYWGCYSEMFLNCTSLVNAPELPATTLSDSCYSFMFHGCAKLKEIYCNARYSSGTTEITSQIGTSWLYGVPDTADCIFYKNPDWTGPTERGTSTIPSNWQIVNWIK